MIGKLRSFSKSKMAGVLVGIIIIPFVFWGMGSVFSGGNTNNVAKINNEIISSKDFINYINESRLTNEIIRENIDNNIIEQKLNELIYEKIIEMEIKELDLSLSEKALANKIRSNPLLLDENKKFSRTKYEKYVIEKRITKASFENSVKNLELRENFINYIIGGIKSPYFLKNKIYIDENKEIDIEYLDLDLIYDTKTTISEIENYIKDNQENLKIDFIDIAYAKITPKNLIEIDEFNDEFFKKIDEIENNILNGLNINEINEIYNLDLKRVDNFVIDKKTDELLKEIYTNRNNDKIQLVDKNDYYLIFEISKINKKIPNRDDPEFIESIKNKLIFEKKIKLIENFSKKIIDKNFTDKEFREISNNKKNIKTKTINNIYDNETFDPDSLSTLYKLGNKSFTLIAGQNNKVYLVKIKNINYSNIDKNDENIKEYTFKANNNIASDLFSTYELSFNSKYKYKIFNQTIDRVKNYFR